MPERSIHLDGTRVLHKSCRPRTSDWQLGFQSRGALTTSRANEHSACQLLRPERIFAIQTGPQTSFFLGLLRENLAAAVHAGLKINMMWTPQLAGILVFHIGRRLERIGGAPEPALHRGRFAFRNGHVAVSVSVRAMESVRASYNEILCLTILKCEAVAAMQNHLSDRVSWIKTHGGRSHCEEHCFGNAEARGGLDCFADGVDGPFFGIFFARVMVVAIARQGAVR
jgi:hypothetical protein